MYHINIEGFINDYKKLDLSAFEDKYYMLLCDKKKVENILNEMQIYIAESGMNMEFDYERTEFYIRYVELQGDLERWLEK